MADPHQPPLTENEIRELAYTLMYWAETHPQPDQPLLAFAGGDPLTPLDIAEAVTSQTPDGEDFIRMVQFGLEVLPLDEILERFHVESPKPAGV